MSDLTRRLNALDAAVRVKLGSDVWGIIKENGLEQGLKILTQLGMDKASVLAIRAEQAAACAEVLEWERMTFGRPETAS